MPIFESKLSDRCSKNGHYDWNLWSEIPRDLRQTAIWFIHPWIIRSSQIIRLTSRFPTRQSTSIHPMICPFGLVYHLSSLTYWGAKHISKSKSTKHLIRLRPLLEVEMSKNCMSCFFPGQKMGSTSTICLIYESSSWTSWEKAPKTTESQHRRAAPLALPRPRRHRAGPPAGRAARPRRRGSADCCCVAGRSLGKDGMTWRVWVPKVETQVVILNDMIMMDVHIIIH